MSTATIPTASSSSRRRRRTSGYVRLEAEKKAQTRAKHVTAGFLGVIVAALLVSLGIIAFSMAG
ncbi:hypothetical protein [Hymenobacter lapidiphilus]|uniref:hypothetical protein n=1 Tax=Hymenobacter sp. CCM 8763 TaxID=2303334 RepID=UPI0011C0D14A|nr:hypothetical protein [Hymenobacter sp. CCM 8763]